MHLDISASEHHNLHMRTTLNLDEDVLRAAKSLALIRAKSLGKVISELARRGIHASSATAQRGELPTFTVDHGERPLTLEDVKRIEDEM
jgi:hypothetical protein